MSLLRRTPLRRGVPALVPAEVLVLLRHRSGGWCEVAAPGCWSRASEAHHRLPRRTGGRPGRAHAGSDRVSNLLDACASCHQWLHAHPRRAYAAGWLVAERRDPPFVACTVRGVWCYLADDGRVVADQIGLLDDASTEIAEDPKLS